MYWCCVVWNGKFCTDNIRVVWKNNNNNNNNDNNNNNNDNNDDNNNNNNNNDNNEKIMKFPSQDVDIPTMSELIAEIAVKCFLKRFLKKNWKLKKRKHELKIPQRTRCVEFWIAYFNTCCKKPTTSPTHWLNDSIEKSWLKSTSTGR